MAYKNLILEMHDSVAIIKINRPEAANALDTITLDELLEAEKDLADNNLVRVVVITGQGTKAFVSGGDIREMKELNSVNGLSFSSKGHLALSGLEKMGKAVIAAVNGYALGGGLELALACDIIYASEKAQLGFPEVTLGIVPGFGGTQRTAKLIGLSRAKELVLSGKVISARQAHEMGLVNQVFPDDQLMGKVEELARQIAGAGPVAVALAKNCVNKSLSLDIDSGLEYEGQAFAICCDTDDKNDAMTAFLEKRAPKSGAQ